MLYVKVTFNLIKAEMVYVWSKDFAPIVQRFFIFNAHICIVEQSIAHLRQAVCLPCLVGTDKACLLNIIQSTIKVFVIGSRYLIL